MTLSESIVKHGTDAVLKYRDISGNEHDNDVPEVFLGSFIARGLYEERRVNAHIERDYTKIAREFGVQVDAELKSIMQLHRADVTVYNGKQPTAIIEIKKYAESGNKQFVLDDLNKMRALSSRTGLSVYVAVLVTDVMTGASYEDRARELGAFLGGTFDAHGPVQKSGQGDTSWSWQFACGSFA